MSKPSNDKSAITMILKRLKDYGWEIISVCDGEEDIAVNNSVPAAVKSIIAVDEARVYFTREDEDDPRTAWVWFVLGNDPEEVAADYTVGLSEVIEPLVDAWFGN